MATITLMRFRMTTKPSKETQLILDSQDRALSGYDKMIRQRQSEMAEKLRRTNTDKKSDAIVAKK